MSNGIDFSLIKSLNLSDSDEFMDIGAISGSFTKQLDNGVIVTMKIDSGKIVEHVAHDSVGNPLKVFYLQTNTLESEEGRNCYCCWGDNDYKHPPFCRKIPCSAML